ncbi:MAG TPA: hypothetical protein VK810_05755 [Dongiaceae bacterium]|jgi:hypothetical protein|nr:hypothetical protein [Dongiaceae bacterium]
MKKTKNIGKVLAVILVGGLSTLVAQAQVATGPWSSWSPGYNLQLVGSGWNSGSQFGITSTSTTTEQRAERRYDTFSTGSKQFQGTVVVNSLGGDRICLCQCFEDPQGPWNMIAVQKSGSLYQVEGGETIAGYTVGSSARINMVCYTGSDKVVNYVNGSLDQTQTGGTGSYYFKFGTYRTGSGKGPITATWTGIQFWQK